MQDTFNALNTGTWQLSLDNDKQPWEEKWVLDGQRAQVKQTPRGMVFEAGPVALDNGSHAVLWTQDSFEGDMKVTCEFTRLDSINRYVNIMYFHANGIGEGPYTKNIHDWGHLREVPYMKTYFEKMDMLHVSYAAFGNQNDDPDDYIRVRRYPVTKERAFHEIEVEPTIFETAMFEPGVATKMTWIKTKTDFALELIGPNKTLYHHWDISKVAPTESGPFGIRHMCQKCSCYKNLHIFTRPK